MPQETVTVDSGQLVYLKYVSALTGIPVALLVREAINDWLEIKYRPLVRDLEEMRKLPSTLAASSKPPALQKAYDNLLNNLKMLEKEKKTPRIQQERRLAVKRSSQP